MARKTKNGYGWGIRAVGTVAWVISVSTVFGGVFAVIRVWAFSPIEASVRVAEFLPGGRTGEVVGGGFTSGTLAVETLPVETRLWMTVSIMSGVALWVWVALTVATLAASVRDGAGFTPRLPRALGFLAVAVGVFGLTLQLADEFAALTLGAALFEAADAGPRTAPASAFALSLDGRSWPLWVALGLGVLCFVFDRAAKLQRDAAGMV